MKCEGVAGEPRGETISLPLPHSFGLFLIAALVLLLIPGPSVLYVIARSLEQGRTAGLVSVFGNALGSALLAACAAVGLSAILAASDLAFNVVKYLGAAYLIYLGMMNFISKNGTGGKGGKDTQGRDGGDGGKDPVLVAQKGLPRIFTQGMFVALLNPKTALFFLAFVPQFVNVSRGGVWEQTLLLGLTLVALGICTDSIYALLAGTVGNWLKRRSSLQKRQRYISGGIYLALGVVSALSGRGK